MDETTWLRPDQQAVWRRWLAVQAQLPAELGRRLQADAGLSLPDFDVLVHLSEVEGGRLRVSGLADTLQWERSRLSHHVRRMEARGLVEREECDDDGRGLFVTITERGLREIRAAAPAHVHDVRELLFDDLDESALAGLDQVLTQVLARLAR